MTCVARIRVMDRMSIKREAGNAQVVEGLGCELANLILLILWKGKT